MLEKISHNVDKVNMIDTPLVKQLISVIVNNVNNITKASIENVSNFVKVNIKSKADKKAYFSELYKQASGILNTYKTCQTYHTDKYSIPDKDSYVQQMVVNLFAYYKVIEQEGKAVVRGEHELDKIKDELIKPFYIVVEEDYCKQRGANPITSIKQLIQEQKHINQAIDEVKIQLKELEYVWYDDSYLIFKKEVEALLNKMQARNIAVCSELSNLMNNDSTPKR